MLLYLLFWTISGFTFHFYIIFGTNRLNGGLAQPIFRINGISNEVQTELNLRERDFLTKRDPGDLDPAPRNKRGGHEGGGRPPRARPPASWAPCCPTDVLLPPIYTNEPSSDQIRSQKPNSTAATFCIHEIPSWGLFRSSVGRGPSSRRASTSS